MDLYKKYAKEEIERVKEDFMEEIELGLVNVIYDLIIKKEQINAYYNHKEDRRIRKLNADEKALFMEELREKELYWDILRKDAEIQSIIADLIEEIEYEEEDEELRRNAIFDTVPVLELLASDKKYDLGFISYTISNKIGEMSNRDFLLIFSNLKKQVKFLNNPEFIAMTKEKIKSMSNEEFAFFLLTIDNYTDKFVPEIRKAIKHRVIELNDPVVTRSFESISESDEIADNGEIKRFDKVASIYMSCKNKEKEVSKLSPKEFIRYCLLNKYSIFKEENLSPNFILVLKEKLKNLTEADFLIILESFYPREGTEKEWDENGESSMFKYLIIKEARNRMLISEDFKKLYYSKDLEDATIYKIAYNDINEANVLKIEYPRIIFDYNEETNDGFEDANQKLDVSLKVLKDLSMLSSLEDKDLCKVANIYNSKIKIDSISRNSIQYTIVNYIKKRIISLQTKYAPFLEITPDGSLSTAMLLKGEELDYYSKNNTKNDEFTR